MKYTTQNIIESADNEYDKLKNKINLLSNKSDFVNFLDVWSQRYIKQIVKKDDMIHV